MRRIVSIAMSTTGLLMLAAAPAAACPEHSPEAEGLLAEVLGAVLSVVT